MTDKSDKSETKILSNLVLGKGCSGEVHELQKEEEDWLRTRSLYPFTHAVKKIFFPPGGSEAIAEYYFSCWFYQRFPHLCVKPLHFVHSQTPTYERFDISTNDRYIFYLEKIQLPLSHDRIGKEENDSRVISSFLGLAEALHDSGLIHNDLNLMNSFFQGRSIQLFDFGKASFDFLLDEPLGTDFCSYFNAPELRISKHFTKRSSSKKLKDGEKKKQDREERSRGNASDLWSLGLCMFILIHHPELPSAQDIPSYISSIRDYLEDEKKQLNPIIRQLLSEEIGPRLEAFYAFSRRRVQNTRDIALKQIPWVNKKKQLTLAFRKQYSEVLARFILVYYQQHKSMKRHDAICLVLGSFNLFLQYLIIRWKQDHQFSVEMHLIPMYVQVCRLLIINLLCPTKRFFTGKDFVALQYLVLQTVGFPLLLLQPLQIPNTAFTCDYEPESTKDLFPLLNYIPLEFYPKIKIKHK